MRFKLWLRRLSISAPRVTIKSHFPWPLKMLFMVCTIALGGAAALWIYDLGRQFTGHDQSPSQDVAAYREQLAKLSAQRDRFSSTVNASESQLMIERSAQKQLAAQVKLLEGENVRLKEDLAFFESLLPKDTGGPEVSIRRLTVDMVGPNQLRYRLLLMQGARGSNDFIGTLQLAVTTLQAGRSAVILFPTANSSDTPQFKLGFRHYQRIEGLLTLPDGTSAKSVQARIFEKGQMRTQASANL
ncbi:DUF6776 family protein [Actimicrobium sp. CCI2.3]|uniref:DUF6776 family protein n=1 Tax=Actimicrobium sp. CCI2.3 TaxID=3048616 RepID=UPI002AB3B2F5|nr:DUF6776 family protein [Actimicrobium sp. CCI2.3]MDY7573467.1 hypothetical protein [Actimicrobium sp. CCI2.3]MEB0022648.1 hypothetical protein [Actimicrobium sp. CCI2.3]